MLQVKRAGWTLAETLVALSLGAVIVVIISQTLTSTTRASNQEMQRGFMQTQLQSVAVEVERALQRTNSHGVAWLPPGAGRPAVLAVHAQKAGAITNRPEWEASWHCFLWDPEAHTLYERICPPGLTAPPTQMATPPDAAGLRLIAALPPAGRLLSTGVSSFVYTTQPGPVCQLDLELEAAIPTRTGREKASTSRVFTLRNSF